MNFFKSLSIYTITAIINSAIPFFLLPILTTYLTPEEYGLLAIIQIFIIFTIPFVSVNIQSTLQLEYYDLKKSEFSLWVSSILIIPIFTLIIIALVFILSESIIHHFLDISRIWFVLIPLIAFFQIVPQIVLTIYKISEKPIDYAKYQLLLTIINLLLTITFVVLFKWEWEGRLLAILMSYLFFTLIGLYILFKNGLIVFNIDIGYCKKALKLGIPLILHVVSAILFMMSDRLFISYYLGNDVVGIYAVGAQVAMIVMIIQEAFNQAWVPFLFKNLKTGLLVNKIKIIKISYLSIAFFTILPFLLYLVTPIIFSTFIGDSFIDSIQYVFWIALGYSLLGMYKVVTNYIFYEKRIKILSAMTFISLLINLLLNYILIHKYGAIGVAYGTAITVGIFFIIAFIVANRVHKMPWLFFIKGKKNEIN